MIDWSDPIHEDCGRPASAHIATRMDDNVVSYECPPTVEKAVQAFTTDDQRNWIYRDGVWTELPSRDAEEMWYSLHDGWTGPH